MNIMSCWVAYRWWNHQVVHEVDEDRGCSCNQGSIQAVFGDQLLLQGNQDGCCQLKVGPKTHMGCNAEFIYCFILSDHTVLLCNYLEEFALSMFVQKQTLKKLNLENVTNGNNLSDTIVTTVNIYINRIIVILNILWTTVIRLLPKPYFWEYLSS